MSLVFALKMIGDLSFYLYFASFFASIFGLDRLLLIPLLVMVLSSTLCRMLRHRGAVRFLPLALIGLCAFYVNSSAAAVTLLLPAAYTVYTVAAGLYDVEASRQRSTFLALVKFMAILPVLSLVLSMRLLFERLSLPFGLMYLLCGVFLLRMLRHESEVYSQTRFRVINGLSLGAVCLVGLLLSSNMFFAALGGLFNGIYTYIVSPLLMLTAYILVGIIWLVGPFFRWLFSLLKRGDIEPPPEQEQPGTGENEFFDILNQGSSAMFERIMTALLIVALIVAAIYIFRKLRGQKAPAGAVSGVTQTRTRIETPSGALRTLLPSLDARSRIRAVYRRFLTLYRSYGLFLGADSTSASVLKQAKKQYWCPEDQAERMREIYISARYSENTPAGADIKEMQRCYSEIKAVEKKSRFK